MSSVPGDVDESLKISSKQTLLARKSALIHFVDPWRSSWDSSISVRLGDSK